MESFYTINEVATMTGLTTRTIRNYLKSGLISGEKVNGVWSFSSEDFCAMLNNPAIKPSIQAKNNAVVYDFIADDRKKTNKICTIIDLFVEEDEAEEISQFFCDTINCNPNVGDLSFKFKKHGKNIRVILSGADETVLEILNGYYNG
ncbi:MAG: MerR family DNA-binding transcriptional regulator [Ruminiclostridium sp.]|nr:MerR family DNA-binding transcriptional regulator [Ruminiclostridium sp.]